MLFKNQYYKYSIAAALAANKDCESDSSFVVTRKY